MTTKIAEDQHTAFPPTYGEIPSNTVVAEDSPEGSLERVPPNRRLLRILVVNRGIGYVNLFAYLIACFATICIVAYLSIVQPFVLTTILRITKDTGTITGSLALYDEIIALPATIFWGILSDRIGRPPVYSAAFVFFGISLILYPYVKNVYPHMLLCRLLFSLGSSAATCMMTGTLSDVVGGQRERGRISALVGIFAGIGGVVAGMALIGVPFELGRAVGDDVKGIRLAMTIVGGCALFLAVVFYFTIPDVHPRSFGGAALTRRCLRREKQSKEAHWPMRKIENPLLMLKYGILAGKDPRVALSYMSSFVSRADTVLFTSFISLWAIQYFIRMGWCQAGSSCGMASGSTHAVTGLAQGLSLIFAPFYGYAGERLNKASVLAFAGVVGAVGSIPFAFTKNDPAAKSNYAFVTLVGIGQIGMIVTGMTLVNGVYVDPKYRGSVAGVFSFCGAVSIMFMARLGGHLFDVWMPGAPFVLMGIAHVIIALFSVYVRIVSPRLERQDREREAAEQQRLKDEAEEVDEIEKSL